MGSIWYVFSIFFLSIVVEVAYSSYIVSVAKQKTKWACFATATIQLLKGWLVLNFVRSPQLLIVVAFGSVIGTYLTLHFTRRWVL